MNRQHEAKTVRNADIISDWNSGCTQTVIAKRYGIGVTRVREIMQANRSSITRFDHRSRSPQPDHHALQLAFIQGTGHSSPHLAIQAGERTLLEWCTYVSHWRVA